MRVSGDLSPIAAQDADQYDEIMRINAKGTLLVFKHAARIMSAQWWRGAVRDFQHRGFTHPSAYGGLLYEQGGDRHVGPQLC